MKCIYCGGQISLQDEKCPYCGRINKPAKRHIADAKRYRKDYENTDKHVKSATGKSLEVLIRAWIIVILSIACIAIFAGMIFLHTDKYENMKEKAVNNTKEVESKMLEYWNAGEYYAFYEYCNKYEIIGWTSSDNTLLQYNAAMNTARCYGFINEDISRYVSASNIYEKNNALGDTCALLDGFYNINGEIDSGVINRIDENKNQEMIAQIHRDMDNMLKTYFYLTDDDLLDELTMKPDEWMTIIEKRIDEHNDGISDRNNSNQ